VTVYQQGTFNEDLSVDSLYRFMPSIAMDRMGNIAIGYSVSSHDIFPQIRYTGRLVTDPLGQLSQYEGIVTLGGGSQTTFDDTPITRWGDYTMMSVDPSDDCTFYYVNQYLPESGTFNWRTAVAAFKFPSCISSCPIGWTSLKGSLTSTDFCLKDEEVYKTFTGATTYCALETPAAKVCTIENYLDAITQGFSTNQHYWAYPSLNWNTIHSSHHYEAPTFKGDCSESEIDGEILNEFNRFACCFANTGTNGSLAFY